MTRVSQVSLYHPKMTLSMRVGHVIPPTQLIWHISREISIEHPSVGLASLAQLDSHPSNFQFSMRAGGIYYLLFIMDGGLDIIEKTLGKPILLTHRICP